MGIKKLEVARQRLMIEPLVKSRLRAKGVVFGRGLSIRGMPITDLVDGSTIELGDHVTLVSHPRWTALGVSRPVILRTLASGARISIGSGTGMSGTTICAAVDVTVGERVLIGADVLIADTDFHPVDSFPRTGLPVPPGHLEDRVAIGDDTFIGARSIVLRGVRIGPGSVIGAGSLVTKDIPAGVVAAGSPARVLREIANETR